ncbi:MAG: hypothetical protein SGILL_005136, partial [Bacillariaceae sp.]
MLLALSPQQQSKDDDNDHINNSSSIPKPASWFQRNIFYRIAGRLSTPRLVTGKDPALKLPKKAIQQRQSDETELRRLMEEAQALQLRNQNEQQPPKQEQLHQLGQKLFQTAYGKGVTPQQREDFLVRYGCTGWTEEIVEYLVSSSIADNGI